GAVEPARDRDRAQRADRRDRLSDPEPAVLPTLGCRERPERAAPIVRPKNRSFGPTPISLYTVQRMRNVAVAEGRRMGSWMSYSGSGFRPSNVPVEEGKRSEEHTSELQSR